MSVKEPKAKVQAKRKPTVIPTKRMPLAKIVQPHGGALNVGGTWGNRGGQLGGRPPEPLRQASRDGYAAVIALVESWVDEVHADPSKLDERIPNLLSALDKFGKYGLGQPVVQTDESFINAVKPVMLNLLNEFNVPQARRDEYVDELVKAISGR